MPALQNARVIIIGAGPAGLSAALHLARFAPQLIPEILILEKQRHPRLKVCGGGLMPDAERILARLGLDVSEIGHVDVDRAYFLQAGQGVRVRPEEDRAYAFRTICRQEFDAWLAEKARQAGICILEDTPVLAIEMMADGVALKTSRGETRAEIVIGADGAGSLVRRAIAPSRAQQMARLVEVETPEPGTIEPDSAAFEFQVLQRGILGYAWDFPAISQGQRVRLRGIYDSNLWARRQSQPLVQVLGDELRRQSPAAQATPLQSAPLRWFDARAPLASARLLLAGDAAGADGLLGEGISFALGYGALAARAAVQALASGDVSFSTYRGEVLRSSMGRALRARAVMARIFYRLHPAPIQALIWRGFGPLVIWLARRLLIGWAERGQKRRGDALSFDLL